jgi:hypothetical protein
MLRRSKDSGNKKSSRVQLEKLYRYCRYCSANRRTHRFDKHQKACKTRWEIFQERRNVQTTQLLIGRDSEPDFEGSYSGYPSLIPSSERREFVQGSSTMLVDIDMANDLPVPSPSIMGLDNFATDLEQTGTFLWVKLDFKIIIIV